MGKSFREEIRPMKKICILLCLCLLILVAVACSDASDEPQTLATDPSESATATEASTNLHTEPVPEASAESLSEAGESPTDAPIEIPTEPSTEAPTQEETEAPVPERTAMDMYGDGYNVNMLVGFDEYGRSLSPVSSRKEDKEVGIFYFLWLGQHNQPEVYDIPSILEQYGEEMLFHTNDPKVSPAGQFHWWEEPLYGYYNSADEFIIRKHLEMLTSAGVDFLMFDATNTLIYANVAEKIMKVICELREKGWDAPQITWITHSRSIQTIQNLYGTFYAKNKYKESWYCVDGKPMMIGYTTAEKDMAEAATRGDTSYNPGDLPQKLQDFFYMREVRWPWDPLVENGWPYTEWQYPQPVNTDMMSVSIATHPGVPFSFSLTHENWMNWGRGYDTKKKVNVHEDIYRGTFFDAQWKIALRRDPRFVCITGWNEWVAQKNWYGGEYTYTDNVDMEYSRDAEPMKGGYEDAYYIQMMSYIRQYKYNTAEGMIADTLRKTIDVQGDASQWADVNAIYRRIGSDNGLRDSVGGAASVHYKQDAVTNNITEVRVTNDADNLYFYIRSEADMVVSDAENFMNIFIGTGTNPTVKGWESYEYVIGRSRDGQTATVEALNADYTGTKLDAVATYTVQGNVMQVSIPRAALGLENGGDFYFKVADGVADTDEIMDYYVTGRSLPMGRLSYLYQMDK